MESAAQLLAGCMLERFVDYVAQTNAIVPYLILSLAYLGILFFAKTKRDVLGFALVLILCVALGLRDVSLMPIGADPVLYASLLSNSIDIQAFAGGIDFALFTILHPLTATLDLKVCFLILHLLYFPILYLLFRLVRNLPGVFFLMSGWMLFVNSGLLLLANFFRQGMSVILLLALIISLVNCKGNLRVKSAGTLLLPVLHVASAGLLPGVLLCRKRRYSFYWIIIFTALCCVIHFAPGVVQSRFSDYFGNADVDLEQTQMWAKVVGIYVMLAVGYFIDRRCNQSSELITIIKKTAIGFLLPTGALLLTLNEPVIGLRYLYYFYAMAFLYLACVTVGRRNESLFKIAAMGICLFGLITWTYPTVARLMVW